MGADRARSRNEVLVSPGHVTDATFATDVLQASEPVLVDFWAQWCPPCRTIVAPALDELAGSLPGIRIVKVNIDESPATTVKYGVMSAPTLMIFKGGALVARHSGPMTKQKIERWIAAAV